MKWLLSLLLCFPASAQIPQRLMMDELRAVMKAAAASAGFVPTNEPSGSGANIISWWRGDYASTNGSVFNLIDLAGVHSWNLTNGTSASQWPTPSGSNTWRFDLDGVNQYVCSSLYTSPQPHEVILVAKLRKITSNGNGHYLDSNSSSTYRNRIYCDFGNLVADGGAEISIASAKWSTNQFYIFDFIFNSTASIIFTNGLVGVSGDAGTKSEGGLVLGNSLTKNSGVPMEVAEVITYSSTNSPTQRSNINYYLKTFSYVSTNLSL